MTTVEINETEARVLEYLRKYKKFLPEYFDKLVIFGARANDIVKIIQNPDACGHWRFDYVYTVFEAIKKINKKYLIPFPEIEEQTEEDRVISYILKKNAQLCLGTTDFFKGTVNVNHVIEFMERNPVIYDWNADFVLNVQYEVMRVKNFLL